MENEVKLLLRCMKNCLVSLIRDENENYMEVIVSSFHTGKDQKVWKSQESEVCVC